MSEATYSEFLIQMKERFNAFMAAAEEGATNKTSALQARKASLEVRKDIQTFRKKSVENDKANTNHRAPKAAAAPAPAADAPAAGV